jgi:hypothetical protein
MIFFCTNSSFRCRVDIEEVNLLRSGETEESLNCLDVGVPSLVKPSSIFCCDANLFPAD